MREDAVRSQFRALVRLFLERFFRTGSAGKDAANRGRLSGTFAALTVVLPIVFFLFLTFYLFVAWGEPETVWPLGTHFFGLLMIVSGLLSVAAWDALFPDEVDQAVLAGMPVPRGVLMWAKAASVGLFAGLSALVLCAFTPAIFAGFALPAGGGVRSLLGLLAGYYAGALLACLFTFLACGALRGIPLLMPTWRAARFVSGVIQSALAILLIGGFAFLPAVASSLPQLAERDSSALLLMPPAWSVGVVQVLSGHGNPAFERLALAALMAPLAAGVAFVALLSVGFLRFARLRADRGSEGGAGSRGALGEILNALILRQPQSRATFWFFAFTLWRGPSQRLRLVTYVGAAAGWVFLMEAVGFRGLRHAAAILGFLAVVGIRSAAATAFQERAAWILAQTETTRKGPYLSGLRWGVWLTVLAPLFFALSLLLAMTRPPAHFGFHLAFNFLAACLLAEGLVLTAERFPFSALPGPGRLEGPPLFIVGFWTYVKALGLAEEYLLTSAVPYLAACGALALSLACVALLRRSASFEFQFQEGSGNLLACSISESGEED